jgi:pimeloyl-ACP methyl ester carboxylesterase
MYSAAMAKLAVPALVNGIAVWSRGEGPAIVLLHANGGDHRDFDAIVDQLAEDHTVHAIDWPGHGASTSPTRRTAAAFARALPAVLAELPGAPFVILGNSVGGFAAIQVAATHPELVRALILVAPGGFTPSWIGARVACQIIGSRPVAPRAMRLLPRLYLRRPPMPLKPSDGGPFSHHETLHALKRLRRSGAASPRQITTRATPRLT